MPSPESISSIYYIYLTPEKAALLAGMVFGIKPKFLPELTLTMQMAGLSHIMVLSGFNISLLIISLTALLKPVPRYLALVITTLLIIFFILFVHIQGPLLRAAIMSILPIFALFYGRRANSLYLLVISIFIVSLFSLDLVTSISFQLSCAATFGIILFGYKIDRSYNYIKNQLNTTLAAQAFTVPIILYYFNTVSVVSVISNILVSFTVAPVTLLGIFLALVGNLNPSLGYPFGFLTDLILGYILWVAHTLATLPFATLTINQ